MCVLTLVVHSLRLSKAVGWETEVAFSRSWKRKNQRQQSLERWRRGSASGIRCETPKQSYISVCLFVCLSISLTSFVPFIFVSESLCIFVFLSVGLFLLRLYLSEALSIWLAKYLCVLVFVSLNLCLCFFVSVCITLSHCLSLCLAVCHYLCLSACLSVYRSISLSVYVSVWLNLSVCLNICVYIYLCVSLHFSIYLSICLYAVQKGTYQIAGQAVYTVKRMKSTELKCELVHSIYIAGP